MRRWLVRSRACDSGPGSAMTVSGESHGRIRVVIADDTAEVRALLRYTLELDGRFLVVGQAGDGREAIAEVDAEKPDAVVLDLAMPVMDGLSAIEEILAVSPTTRIVVLSGFDARQMAEEALRRGAHAYLEKGATFTELTSVLADLCPPWGTSDDAREDDAAETADSMKSLAALAHSHPSDPRPVRSRPEGAGDDGTAAELFDPCQTLRARETAMRLARWVGILFAIV